MSRYSCVLAEKIGHEYNLAPEQVWPGTLRALGSSWHPQGRDLSGSLNATADRLDEELRRLGLPQSKPVQCDEDGREMARREMSGNPAAAALLSEMERGWARRDAMERG